MKEKCRNVTATLLCCILAFLSVAAELSHHHGLATATDGSSVSAAPKSEKNGALNTPHGYNCVACQFAVTQLAVFPLTTIAVTEVPASFGIVASLCPDPQFFFQFSSLRAPPAVPA